MYSVSVLNEVGFKHSPTGRSLGGGFWGEIGMSTERIQNRPAETGSWTVIYWLAVLLWLQTLRSFRGRQRGQSEVRIHFIHKHAAFCSQFITFYGKRGFYFKMTKTGLQSIFTVSAANENLACAERLFQTINTMTEGARSKLCTLTLGPFTIQTATTVVMDPFVWFIWIGNNCLTMYVHEDFDW